MSIEGLYNWNKRVFDAAKGPYSFAFSIAFIFTFLLVVTDSPIEPFVAWLWVIVGAPFVLFVFWAGVIHMVYGMKHEDGEEF